MPFSRVDRFSQAERLQSRQAVTAETIGAIRRLMAVIEDAPGPLKLTVPANLYRRLSEWLVALLEDEAGG